MDLRPARAAHIAELAEVFAAAFHDDPPFVWALPDAASRRRRLRRIFVTMFRHEPAGRLDVAEVGGRVTGGALWLRPGHWNQSVLSQLAAMPGFLRGFGRRIPYGQRLVTASVAVHPSEPHWHLSMVGVAPSAQGQGVGAALLRRGLAVCDAEHLPSYLESTKLENVALYAHFGFERVGTLPLPDGAPVMTTMWRTAR